MLITDHGAKGDGKFLNTAIIQDCIEKLSQRGGGQLVVPPGDYLTGMIELKGRINLHLMAGARLIAALIRPSMLNDNLKLVMV